MPAGGKIFKEQKGTGSYFLTKLLESIYTDASASGTPEIKTMYLVSP